MGKIDEVRSNGAETTRRLFDEASLFQRGVGAVLVDGLQGARGELHGHELLQLGHPDALGLQVGQEVTGGGSGHVLTDAALLLSETTTVNFASAKWLGSSHITNSAHK